MEEKVLTELEELKKVTLLGAKTALTMEDASLLTGLSKSHLYKKVCKKEIPFWKGQGGKLTYFNKNELTEWMLHRRVKTTEEIESEAATYCVTHRSRRVAV